VQAVRTPDAFGDKDKLDKLAERASPVTCGIDSPGQKTNPA
jgi:hypothetical protein